MNIIQFARRAGVSTATVSRAFHEPHKLRVKTRDAIIELAGQVGYYPSPSGRALKRGRHDVLGVIWPLEVEGPEAAFAQRMLAALTRHLVKNDLDLLVCPVDRKDPATLAHARRTLQRSRCDAWVLLYPRHEDVLVESIRASGKPVVCLMGRLPEVPEWKSVCLNQQGWMADALGRLKKAGCKNVLLFGGRDGEPDHEERLKVFGELALRCFKGKSAVLQSWPADVSALACHLRCHPVDGIVGVDDQAALVALKACRSLKRSVPLDVKVVGIDDIPDGDFSNPPLSSYRQPLDEMAGCAVDLALGLRKKSKTFEATFIPKGSLP